MSYTAPDPEQFAEMKDAFDYIGPLAAVNITMPAFVFGGPCAQLSRIIYLNQCNPGEIMEGGAFWLQIAQRYGDAKDKLQELVNELGVEQWEGKDRDAFDEKTQKIIGQLEVIQAFAMHVGISLFTIGTMLAVMLPIMLAFATVLMGLAIACMAVRFIVPAGPIMALAYRATAMTFGGTALATLKAMDEANGMVAQGLAAFIGANMTVSWGVMASKGNIINPANTIASTAYSLVQGLAQLAVVKLMAPGKGAGGLPGGASPAGTNALIGAAGAQGIYGMGNSMAGEDAPNKMTEADVDVGKYDFMPGALDQYGRAGDEPPDWTPGEPNDQDAPEKAGDPAGQA